MTSQVLSEQSIAIVAFARLLRAHASLTRALSAKLESQHSLTISDFEVLLRLAAAPERRLKRVDLAAAVILSPSGITRLLDGLEAQGLVSRAACATDRRVTYAVLTDEGRARYEAAARDHRVAVEEAFGTRLGAGEVDQLAELLSRLVEPVADAACDPSA
jgi:DNA-binding MarR family transcriptional regulator